MVAKQISLSHQYGCIAYMTIATFVIYGVTHRARRFFRADLPGTGKIELYTISPDAPDQDSAFSEDWLGYANLDTLVGRRAAQALDDVDSTIARAQEERVSSIEML